MQCSSGISAPIHNIFRFKPRIVLQTKAATYNVHADKMYKELINEYKTKKKGQLIYRNSEVQSSMFNFFLFPVHL